jgi:hypothetical protein
VDKRSLLTYVVYSLDVWGHSAEDCEEICKACFGSGKRNDSDCECERCDCLDCDGSGFDHENCVGFDVNDHYRVGRIQVETDEGATYNIDLRGKTAANGLPLTFTSWSVSDAALVEALKVSFLKNSIEPSDLKIEGEEEGLICLDDARTGRPVFQLEFEKAEELP